MSDAEFDHFAADYSIQHARSIRISGESVEYFSQYKIDIIASHFRDGKFCPQNILDFGAGVGSSIAPLRRAFPSAEIICLDVSETSLKMCKEKDPTVNIMAYDGKYIPFEDSTFDFIFTACVFHHIPHAEHVSILREIQRVLTKNGQFILFEHNPWNPLTRLAVHRCPFDANAHLISAPEMRHRLFEAGFSVAQLDYRLFFPAQLALLRPCEPFLTRVPLGAQYSLIARA